MGLHHTKKILHGKEIIRKMKRQSMEWEKISANHISDQGLTQKHICTPCSL